MSDPQKYRGLHPDSTLPFADPVAAAEPLVRVLLVDDDQDTLDLLGTVMRAGGFAIETAHNGNEALEKIARHAPDVVVADVMMDGMSGYDLCRMVRTMGFTELPFVFCSALGTSVERVMGLRFGADDYLVKPFDPDELLLKVQRLALRRPLPRLAPPARDPSAKKRILVVDDDAPAAAAVRPYLLEKGYEVEVVGSGNDALDALRLRPPDLVILDVVMPILSGLDVCRWIRQDPSVRLLPVILLSARKRAADIVAGESAGADLYLTKPVVGRRLVNLVEMFLSRDAPLQKRQAGRPAPDSA